MNQTTFRIGYERDKCFSASNSGKKNHSLSMSKSGGWGNSVSSCCLFSRNKSLCWTKKDIYSASTSRSHWGFKSSGGARQ